ncbi:universal stress protein [Secundilactobacillus similis DSM 23365 = JCM 2765]|uniref:Universal stress protein n=2 Tax=Secundilactobacillus similis TaxID=414682 RepID=A0A0R2EX54_9LACO|nr:hypothetical protein FD14_GL002006 [Secundilactobacillus similis DSM 23365 = JCM 2765]
MKVVTKSSESELITMYQHIAVPLDGSHNAQLALNEALKLVKTFNAKLTLINVIDDKRLIYSVTSTGIAHTGGYYEELTTHAKDVLAEGQAIAAKQGITAETAILHGNPKQVIAEDFPHDHKVDLIVMGKSGTDAMDRLLVGSTTASVVRTTQTNVLVVAEAQ